MVKPSEPRCGIPFTDKPGGAVYLCTDSHSSSEHYRLVALREHTTALDSAVVNSDRELWREKTDFYSPSIHVTAEGAIGINVGGTVHVMSVRRWHALADNRPPPQHRFGCDRDGDPIFPGETCCAPEHNMVNDTSGTAAETELGLLKDRIEGHPGMCCGQCAENISAAEAATQVERAARKAQHEQVGAILAESGCHCETDETGIQCDSETTCEEAGHKPCLGHRVERALISPSTLLPRAQHHGFFSRGSQRCEVQKTVVCGLSRESHDYENCPLVVVPMGRMLLGVQSTRLSQTTRLTKSHRRKP